MSTTLLTGLSGFQAASVRLDARSSNIANVQSNGPLPTNPGPTPGATPPVSGGPSVYQAVEPVTQATVGGGAKTLLSPTTPGYVQQYDPNSSFANSDGLVAAPNVDLAGQITASIADSAYSKTNAAIIRTGDELLRQAINLKS
jgi:flagellar basal-body rod protein FlgC